MFASKDTLLTRPSGYNIARSVRLRKSASAYFNRTTTSSVTNNKIFTFSMWVKRGIINDASEFEALVGGGPTNADTFGFGSGTNAAGDYLQVRDSGGGTYNLLTTQLFRDPSAWYHFVLAVDTTQATASNRVKLYVNGVQVTSFSTATYPAQNFVFDWNTASTVYVLGRRSGGNSQYYFDGYLTEINFVDGQQLTPSSFGETDSITGVWKPKAYSGTYGTNGFELNFSDNSNNTAATIGKDYSGNGNNWTPNNISVTSGATYDSMVDSPTVGATSSNYGTWNPLSAQASATYTNGNMTASVPNGGQSAGGFPVTSGKWYAEVVCTANPVKIGIRDVSSVSYANNCIMYDSGGQKYLSGTASAYGASWTTNDVIGIAIDMDGSTVTFYKNNTSQGSISLSGQGITAAVIGCLGGGGSTGTYEANWGQRPFTYTPPTGYVALNTYNLPASTIKNGAAYMAATTYTGNGTTQSISNAVNGVSFQPDFVWFKNRSGANNHALYDSVRGRALGLISNATNAEQSASAGNDLVSFDSNGVSLGPVEDFTSVNGSAQSIVAWQWKAGGTSASNTNGTITSTVSVGATQGFSVVTYTGNGTLNATIGHGLGVAPSMVIIKNRVGANNWDIYHISNGAQKYMDFTTAGVGSLSTIFPTTPTSSVVYLGTTGGQNTNATNYVAYCFSAVAGYSAIGSYTGNSSTDGTFVYTGFRPRFVLIKGTGSGGSGWQMNDSSRNTYNPEDAVLRADLSNAETTAYGNVMDFLSNGFKLRVTDTNYNSSSTTYGPYIYMAFAENPFKHSLAR